MVFVWFVYYSITSANDSWHKIEGWQIFEFIEIKWINKLIENLFSQCDVKLLEKPVQSKNYFSSLPALLSRTIPRPGVVVHACNPSTWEAKAGKLRV
jgi:hypothetical protein